MGRKVLIVVALCGVLAFVAAAGRGSVEGASPKPTVLVLPKDTYTCIVFTATGVPNGVSGTAVIKFKSNQFLVNLAPGTTTAIPFGNGWELSEDGEIVLTRGADASGAVPTAWAINKSGPVALRPR